MNSELPVRFRALRRRDLCGLLSPILAGVVLLVPSPTDAEEDNSDDAIYNRVIRNLVNDYMLKTNALEVEVKDAVVTVSGSVTTEKLRRRVDKVVKKTKGVKKVVNKVEVRRP